MKTPPRWNGVYPIASSGASGSLVPMSRPLLIRACLLGLALASSCGIAGCGGHEVDASGAPGGPLQRLSGSDHFRGAVEREGPERWTFDVPLEPERWRELQSPRRWQADRPFGGGTRFADSDHIELLSALQEFVRIPYSAQAGRLGDLGPGEYLVAGDWIQLRPIGDALPDDLVLRLHPARTPDQDDRRRAALEGTVGDGFALGHGGQEALDVWLTGRDVLRFKLCAADPRPFQASEPASAALELEVSVGGEVLTTVRRNAESFASGAWESVVIEGGVTGWAQLEFRASFASKSPFARAAVLAPTVAPSEFGSADRRPDVVLLLLDTFRADNLAAYGAEASSAPELDRFAERATVFTGARSPSAWTLPSQTSLLAGVAPFAHGAVTKDLRMSPEWVTVAEAFQAAGYRTAAVTDSNFVSRVFGFDQGFETFTEHVDWSLPRTLADADRELAHDDGRPLFLFVQTYRAHGPYRTGVEESVAGHEALQLETVTRVERFGGDGSLELVELAELSTGLYREGVRGLDLVLGPWLGRLDERGFFRSDYLIVTSDHGEAFLEHGDHGHGRPHHLEQLAVPLILRGPGLDPRRVPGPASLLDLPRTLAGLGGVPVRSEWAGRDLLNEGPASVTRGYDLMAEEQHLSIERPPYRLLVTAGPGELLAASPERAYDTSSDPAEQRNLAQESPAWVAELWASQAAAIERDLTPGFPALQIELQAGLTERLEAIGYVDE